MNSVIKQVTGQVIPAGIPEMISMYVETQLVEELAEPVQAATLFTAEIATEVILKQRGTWGWHA